MKRDVVVIGSGFAGSVLARLLALGGRDVLLVERDAHPRFSLGESSTPLAALSLERLARRYQQPDLDSLAAHGRWRRNLASLRCGQKRGFTFYRHHPGAPYGSSDAYAARFLVAASPDAYVADCHWMRADVDAYLVEQARAVGVDYRDRLEIVAAESVSDGMRLRGRHGGSEIQIETGFVVDASGAGEVMARALGIESTGDEIEFSSRLVYSHFEGVQPFADAALGAGACLPVGPYADNLAAVHHLIDEGWIYALNFDDGLTSVGMLIDLAYAPGGSQLPDAANPDELWRAVVDRYPTLRTAFTGAKSLPPGLRSTARLQRRRRQAVGARWAMLPQTFAFFDPLFSTGIAWSLLGVERLAELLAEPVVSTSALDRYQALLMAEADQQQALLEAAYTARRDFTVFRDLSFLYFACVSFEEIRQRLLDRPNDPGVAWRGLLGAGDPHWTSLFRDAGDRVAETLTDGSEGARRRFSAWVTSGIRSRNLVGLGMSKTHLYGLDTAHLVESSALLGLTAAEMKSALPRLRGSIRSDEIG